MKKSLLFFLLLCTNIAYAIIVEHHTLDALFNYLDTHNTLVVFDIDNTLATTQSEIGSDQWFSYLVAQKQQQGFELEHAINLALPTYFHVQFNVPLVPVENGTADILKSLTEHNIPTVALTARSLYIADRTLEQLKNINIKLSPMLSIHELCLTMPTHIPSMYKDGILFVGTNTKGNVLVEFLKESCFYPAKIIFIDDKRKYLESVEQALLAYAQKTGKEPIEFVGIRYSACDERVKNFDAHKADIELAEFNNVRTRPTPRATA